MLTLRTHSLAIYADRSTQQWIVRDREDNFWIVPAGNKPSDRREPCYPTEETELEPLPGHYKHLLELPM